MDDLYNKDFFLKHDYENIIKSHLQKIDTTNPAELKLWVLSICNLKDTYISIYLLLQLKPNANFVDDEVALSLFNLQLKYKTKIKYHLISVKKIIHDMLNYLDCEKISLKVFIHSFNQIKFTKNEIISLRKIFSFSQIFKYYQEVMSSMFHKKVTMHEIILLFNLLDNNEIAYKQMVPIFQRTTQYVTQNFLEKSVVSCCEAIKALVIHDKSFFKEKFDYLASLSSYLVQILRNPHNYAFLSLDDVDNLVDSIKVFVSFCKDDKKSLKISAGTFKKGLDFVVQVICNKKTVYEEFVALVSILDIIYIYFEAAYNLGSRIFDYDEIIKIISNINPEIPPTISHNEWATIYNRFLEKKYRFIDFLLPLAEKDAFDMNIFYCDMSTCYDAYNIIKILKNFVLKIDWNKMITIACLPQFIEDYAELIFNNKYLKNIDNHYDYIKIYIHSLKKMNRQDLVLFCEKFMFDKFSNKNLSQTHREYFIDMFLQDIDNNDSFPIISRRKKTLDFLFYRTIDTQTHLFINEFLHKLDVSNYTKYNLNIVALFLVLVKKDDNLPDNTISHMCEYFISVLCYNYKPDTFEESHIVKIYIASFVSILCRYKHEITFDDCDLQPCQKTFYKLYVAILSCVSAQYNMQYIDTIKKYLFNFLFSADRFQQSILGNLFRKCDPAIVLSNEKHPDIINIYNYINDRMDAL
ncbi:hypothetical protein EDEG_00737 [Edhazardia aedis USNM 41457]|uniref:Uncharacterized protein n=1 Tax=Edhazardia aedis (strain USNM 41457) TaxID=1003232 RepID=J9DCJ0_EDHAE|nr:hypothetical protein EDEG_00737 [Edhazardia aedis USNM 41457]|eukprot:EJW05179.1 hypothetical protein EDEG_00737 [Edhazardia aedis USNM 41457]